MFCYLVDQAFSLANPSIKGQDVPQPLIFDGKLKSYQLKVNYSLVYCILRFISKSQRSKTLYCNLGYELAC